MCIYFHTLEAKWVRVQSCIARRALTSNIDCFNPCWMFKILIINLFQFYVPVSYHMSTVSYWDFMYCFFFLMATSLVSGEENYHPCYAWCGWKIRERKVSDYSVCFPVKGILIGYTLYRCIFVMFSRLAI